MEPILVHKIWLLKIYLHLFSSSGGDSATSQGKSTTSYTEEEVGQNLLQNELRLVMKQSPQVKKPRMFSDKRLDLYSLLCWGDN